ncbi:MAG: CrcB family protein [Sphingobacteriales bacterium]|nr:MAG: CrcB family protein [Sphingobacteriales bacterium]
MTVLKFLFVFLGGGLGSVSRFSISMLAEKYLHTIIPAGTAFVNIAGSFLIGFLGGFTTFSSFSLETYNLYRGGNLQLAMLNIIINVLLCMGAVWLGSLLARHFSA